MFEGVHYYNMIATAVIFLILIFVLNSVLFKPLLKFMDERSANIANNLAKVHEETDEIEAYERELKEIHAKAIEEAGIIRDEIIEEAKAKADAMLAKKQVELDLDMNKFYKDLHLEKEEVYKALEKNLDTFKLSYEKTLKQI